MSRPLCPRNGNDLVFTPIPLSTAIIRHFRPMGTILDPCKGVGAFYDHFPTDCQKDWCEITEGRDFLIYDFGGIKFDWTIGNPPWSLIRPFLKRAMEVSDNVVFLCLVNAFFMKARLRDMADAGFGIKEIVFVDTPPRPWPQTGFALGATHIKRDYSGPVTFSRL
jgi:hypothetical protein